MEIFGRIRLKGRTIDVSIEGDSTEYEFIVRNPFVFTMELVVNGEAKGVVKSKFFTLKDRYEVKINGFDPVSMDVPFIKDRFEFSIQDSIFVCSSYRDNCPKISDAEGNSIIELKSEKSLLSNARAFDFRAKRSDFLTIFLSVLLTLHFKKHQLGGA